MAADGKTATVTADNAPVFAASIETESAGPDKHWRRQLNIERGKSIQVLGEEGKYYRITPPAGASVYVAPTALRRADASVATMSVAPPTPPAPAAPAATPITAPPVAPAAIPVPAPTTATPPATSTPATTTPPAASTTTLPTTPAAPSTPALHPHLWLHPRLPPPIDLNLYFPRLKP
ncbi:MAG: hypothetical protein HC898_11785 [Phycisphaerales bacterium]|nr:hypothetical protein [Phycisphaerales bacterium]